MSEISTSSKMQVLRFSAGPGASFPSFLFISEMFYSHAEVEISYVSFNFKVAFYSNSRRVIVSYVYVAITQVELVVPKGTDLITFTGSK